MPTYTLTILDAVGIQEYVFGSNVLRENIGASELVRRATRLWPFEKAREAGKTNVKAASDLTGDAQDLDDAQHIEDGGLVAEVIYAGGGNCAVLFTDPDKARDFVTSLSRQILEAAPDLDLVAVHVEVDWSNHVLAEKMKQALDQLAIKKLNRRVSTSLLGLGTTIACRSTGLPAVGTDADEPDLKPPEEAPRPLSAGILAKLRYLTQANQYLEELLPQFMEAGLRIPHDFDNFGRKAGDISYIAVVHADGNGMGSRIGKLRNDSPTPEDNRPYIQAMRDFSRAVELASRQALTRLSTALLRHWEPREDTIVGKLRNEHGEIVSVGKPVKLTKGQWTYIPFRPIVFGGDDLTFVADGRLGITLAALYLDEFEQAMNAQDNRYTQELQACAGVTVVKTHYPFSRAYVLAENLCGNAKKVWDRKGSALDWHIAATGLFGDIGMIRERQYTVPAGHLEMRPVPLCEDVDLWRSWPAFVRIAGKLQTDEWKDKHNKVIALRQALRDGPEAVINFCTAYGLELPTLAPGIASLQTTGWDGAGRCGHFDAVEALDFFLPLEG